MGISKYLNLTTDNGLVPHGANTVLHNTRAGGERLKEYDSIGIRVTSPIAGMYAPGLVEVGSQLVGVVL